MNPRLAAARALLALERGSSTLTAELERVRRFVADERDRGLVLELTAGTLRWRGELDTLLAAASSRPIDGLDPRVRAVLRLAIYQLRHLDRVPAHAVVHEAVESTRALDVPQAAGFVNAVLRALERGQGAEALPSRPSSDAAESERLQYLVKTMSHPEWMVRRWMARHGFEAVEAWCAFNNRVPDVTVRPVSGGGSGPLLGRLLDAGVDAKPAPFAAEAIVLPPGALGRLAPDLAQEMFVQEEASQIVAAAVGAREGERLLDVCAAPGGKSVALASAVSSGGLMVAGDRRPSRVRLLRTTLHHAGVAAPVVTHDASRGLPFGPVFDRVLVDAPCSGLGTIARDPDVKWSRAEPDLAVLAELQFVILRHAAATVKAGGTLVYATCSSEPEENEAVVRRALEALPGFELEPASPAHGVRDAARFVDADGFFHSWPYRDSLDAFFAARLVRR